MSTNNAINLHKPVPAFGAVNNADQTNVTGDGTIYQILFANEIFDNATNFAASTFTAPVTGEYIFGISLLINGITAAMTNDLIYITAGGVDYRFMQQDFAPGQDVVGNYTLTTSILCPMAATNTAQVFIRFINGAKVVGLTGATAAGIRTPYFYGYLLSDI